MAFHVRRSRGFMVTVLVVLLYLSSLVLYTLKSLSYDRIALTQLIGQYGHLPNISFDGYTSSLHQMLSKDAETEYITREACLNEYRPVPPVVQPSSSKFAFATLLSENIDLISEMASFNGTVIDDDADEYFLAARVLSWQLLKSPRTRSNSSIPFLILVTPDVSARKRAILAAEGATVVEVSKTVLPDWMEPGNDRWRDQLAKLHVLDLTDYEKICYVDLDTLLTGPIDGVFDDPAASTYQYTGSKPNETREDEAKLPETYLFAAHSDPMGPFGYWPPPRGDYFNAGFFVVGPSRELYDYYISLFNLTDRYDGGYVEQNMLNYAHRRSGNMPWAELDDHWNTLWPERLHWENGAVTFHNKFWKGSYSAREAKKNAVVEAAQAGAIVSQTDVKVQKRGEGSWDGGDQNKKAEETEETVTEDHNSGDAEEAKKKNENNEVNTIEQSTSHTEGESDSTSSDNNANENKSLNSNSEESTQHDSQNSNEENKTESEFTIEQSNTNNTNTNNNESENNDDDNNEDENDDHKPETLSEWINGLESVDDEGGNIDPAFRELWLQHRWEMEGFYWGLAEAMVRVKGD